MHDLCLVESMRLMSQACFSILLLILFLFKISSSTANGYAKSQSFRTQPLSNLSPFKGKSRQNTGDGDGEAVLGDEKRIIYTGPNPLHNR